jgi:hypothetical protein
MENTNENLEHIEHHQHAAHSGGFDRKVAMSMAIIAALLATVTMLSHRAHNSTIRLQTEANILRTQATDMWGYYQAQNIRRHAYESNIELLDMMPRAAGTDERYNKTKAKWEKQISDYQAELAKHKEEAEDFTAESVERMHTSAETHHRGDRFDLAELAAELGLVLCSLAVLTKRINFWWAGILAAVVGLMVAMSVLFIHD